MAAPARTRLAATGLAAAPLVVAALAAALLAGPGCGGPERCYDTDDDGLTDARDACPLLPEDWDGFADGDGCPDPDNDRDGLPDVADRCPDDPEDRDGWQDEDGCPDPDDDGDGIPDARDRCPREPETVNGRDDEDGCPDKVEVALDKILIADRVFFDRGSAAVTAGAGAILADVAAILREEPRIRRVRVAGHTRAAGAELANIRLSQRRADAVRDWLVQAGVEAARLQAVGFGEQRPVAREVTAADARLNDRVEFQILELAREGEVPGLFLGPP